MRKPLALSFALLFVLLPAFSQATSPMDQGSPDSFIAAWEEEFGGTLEAEPDDTLVFKTNMGTRRQVFRAQITDDVSAGFTSDGGSNFSSIILYLDRDAAFENKTASIEEFARAIAATFCLVRKGDTEYSYDDVYDLALAGVAQYVDSKEKTIMEQGNTLFFFDAYAHAPDAIYCVPMFF